MKIGMFESRLDLLKILAVNAQCGVGSPKHASLRIKEKSFRTASLDRLADQGGHRSDGHADFHGDLRKTGGIKWKKRDVGQRVNPLSAEAVDHPGSGILDAYAGFGQVGLNPLINAIRFRSRQSAVQARRRKEFH